MDLEELMRALRDDGRDHVADLSAYLEAGGSTDALDPEGWPPIRMAIEFERDEFIRALAEQGANLDVTDAAGTPMLLCAFDYEAEGILQGSKLPTEPDFPITKVLIELGANIEGKTSDGRTLWDYARSRGLSERLAEFLEE